MEVFRYQYDNNNIYHQYCDLLGKKPSTVQWLTDVPFLPVSFFRTHEVVSYTEPPELEFTSSGTTAAMSSRHLLTDSSWYEKSFSDGFRLFYGDPANYCILALLPSYLERTGSSLVVMAQKLIEDSKNPDSGFYLHDIQTLAMMLQKQRALRKPTILLGVSFALLDFAAVFPMQFPELILVETGGMKGRRREMIREEVHEELCRAFGTELVHSEYGMTELLSQAWSKGNGRFLTPPWMKILIRDTNDPLSLVGDGKTGGINIIDLANVQSCSFIAVQDLGRKYPDGSFEVLGRFDQSQIRGCNLMVV